MTAAHLSGITNVKKVFRCYNKSYWWFRTITLGPIDCNVCLHTTLLFPIFFTYTPKSFDAGLRVWITKVKILNTTQIQYDHWSGHFESDIAQNKLASAYTGDELWHGQARCWHAHAHTHTHTHRQTQATTIPEGQYWPPVKTKSLALFYALVLVAITAWRQVTRGPFY